MAENSLTEDLYLFFPQWEGAGKTDVYTGATLLREMLQPGLSFATIQVKHDHELYSEHDIIGYADILRHVQLTHQLLSIKNPRRIFLLGGDCGVSIVPISFLNQKYHGDLAVVWLDAHADANTPQSSPSKTFHGMALRTLLGEGAPELVSSLFSTLLPGQIFLAGVRDLDPPEREFLTQAQVQAFSCAQLTAQPHKIVDAIKKQGFSHVYLHIDVDVLDPVSFPAVNAISHFPTPEGLAMETLGMLHQVITSNLSPVGWSLVEVISSRTDYRHELEQLVTLYAQARR